MTELVTISLSPEQLERARAEALRLGLSVESYLASLVEGGLPRSPPASTERPKLPISAIFGIGASDEPTDIATEKDKLVGEAVWQEHLRKTRQSE